jgi:hypothetical protein
MLRFQAGCTVLLAFAAACANDAPSGSERIAAPDANAATMDQLAPGSASGWSARGRTGQDRCAGDGPGTDWWQTVTQMRELVPATSFRSHDPLELHFGLGDAARADEITVRWPSGIVQRLGPQTARQRITIMESG